MLIDSANYNSAFQMSLVAYLFCAYFTTVFSIDNTACLPSPKRTNAFVPEVVFYVNSTKLNLLLTKCSNGSGTDYLML